MNVQEIKAAVDAGKAVFAGNDNYHVIKDNLGQYLIECKSNGYCVGLTWVDGVTLNAKPEEFYIKDCFGRNWYSREIDDAVAKIRLRPYSNINLDWKKEPLPYEGCNPRVSIGFTDEEWKKVMFPHGICNEYVDHYRVDVHPIIKKNYGFKNKKFKSYNGARKYFMKVYLALDTKSMKFNRPNYSCEHLYKEVDGVKRYFVRMYTVYQNWAIDKMNIFGKPYKE